MCSLERQLHIHDRSFVGVIEAWQQHWHVWQRAPVANGISSFINVRGPPADIIHDLRTLICPLDFHSIQPHSSSLLASILSAFVISSYSHSDAPKLPTPLNHGNPPPPPSGSSPHNLPRLRLPLHAPLSQPAPSPPLRAPSRCSLVR